MKRFALIMVLLIGTLCVYSQSNSTTNKPTSSDTIAYLLNKVEYLEHQLMFLSDQNNLDHSVFQLEDKWQSIKSGNETRYMIRKWMEAMEEKYSVTTECITGHTQLYNYTETETSALNSTCKLIKIYFDLINDWCDGN